MLLASLRRLIGAAVVALSLVAVAPAAADSIAYVQGGDVWLATPDGARRQQVTHTGLYSYVSQADDGTMIALAPGERLHRLSRTGQVVADFLTTVSDGATQAGPVNRFHGPFNPEISPDGTKVAYEWFNDSYSEGTGCTDTTVPPCFVYRQSQGVAISHADRYTGPEEFGLMTGWTYPNWMSNDTLLRSYSGAVLTDDAVFTRVGPGLADSQLDPWFFDDQQGFGVDDVELSRDLKTVVGIAGSSSEKLRVYRTLMGPFGAPDWNHRPFYEGNQPVAQRCYELDGGSYESTTLAPGGRGLAYGTADGIWVAALPDLSGGCQTGDRGTLAIPGGRFPDWGPADVPPASAFAEPPAGTGAQPGGKIARPKLRLGRATLGKALKLTLETGGPGRATVTVRLKGRTLASGSAKVGASGRATLRVTLPRKALGKRRSATATAKATFRPASGGPARSVSAPLALRSRGR